MKRIDKLLITSFIGPFVVTFFIALFVLIMQVIWVYIDDIIGKGAGLLILVEILFYLSMSLIPMALPIAILISSVMVMGNLAERYELASFKSAGVPLLRIMKPLMFLTAMIGIFSFVCSNYLIPIANLKFKSRLYDIRRQKPTLSLQEGVFNYDFKNYVIHIGDKGEDNKSISDVIIYDHQPINKGRPTLITAKRGEMYTTVDEKYFVMNLYDGTQYQESKDNDTDKGFPFIRTSFKEWNKVFDLTEFEIDRTDDGIFKSHYSMLSIAQLAVAIDSLDVKIDKKNENLNRNTLQYFYKYKKEQKEEELLALGDSLSQVKKTAGNKKRNFTNVKGIVPQIIDKPLPEYSSFIELFGKDQRAKLVNKSKSSARNILSHAQTTQKSTHRLKESRVKHIFELNRKYSLAAVCFIFLFIGAPMGAIVRKGGFGYPILIAIIFFMLFIVLDIFCRKIAQSMVIPALLASWIPSMVLAPIGALLTQRAMNDSKIVNLDRYFNFIVKFFKWVSGQKTQPSQST